MNTSIIKNSAALMNKNVSKFSVQLVNELRKNSPTIFSATAIMCLIGSNVAIWKSKDTLVNDFKERKDAIKEIESKEISDELKKKERNNINLICVKNTAVHALPFEVLLAASIASIIASLKINNKRVAIYSAAWAIAERNSDLVKAKTEEIVGKGKKEKIDNAVASQNLNDAVNANNGNPNIINTGSGTMLFLEKESGQLFYASKDYIEDMTNKYNAILNDETSDYLQYTLSSNIHYKDLTEWYELMELPVPEFARLLFCRVPKLLEISYLEYQDVVINKVNTTACVIKFVNVVKAHEIKEWNDDWPN